MFGPGEDLPVIVEMAAQFAFQKHNGQTRRITGEPYFTHVAEVAAAVGALGAPPPVIAAALLHDVIEDTDTTADELREMFGDEVTALVLEVTGVSKREDGNRAVRKRIDLEHYRQASFWGKTIKVCDRSHNAQDIAVNDPAFWASAYRRETVELVVALGDAHKSAVESLRAFVTSTIAKPDGAA